MELTPNATRHERAPRIDHEKLGLEVFATCPSSASCEPEGYLAQVKDVARWSEAAGCRGILVYTDNGLVDPWLVAQIILQETESLCPLVATQPVYMHPYTVAKKIATLAFLHARRVYLNMVAGGFRGDLLALDDPTPHDRRYDRLVEYTNIIRRLLGDREPLTFEGEFYRVKELTLKPPLPPELFPGLLISGSSPAGRAAARAIEATAVEYPEPPSQCRPDPALEGRKRGLRVGVIARDDSDEAWRIAEQRFPPDRRGQITHQVAMKLSDSHWHKRLSEIGEEQPAERCAYWLRPFENYKTFCPYLVGSYAEVAAELRGYMEVGYRTFILDIPPSEEELHHTGAVFSKALEAAA